MTIEYIQTCPFTGEMYKEEAEAYMEHGMVVFVDAYGQDEYRYINQVNIIEE